jgi:hypothetical protein
MNTQHKNKIWFIVSTVVLTFSWGTVYGDDLNPPTYRGDPLSVHAEWQFQPGTTFLNLTQFNWVDDNDPTTTLHPLSISNPVQLNGSTYDFQLPNFIDTMPVKYMRLQLTWINTPQTPISIFTQAMDGTNPILGTIVYTLPPIMTTGGMFYQYYDILFQPNPDFERVHVQMPLNGLLTQAVIDTVSTVPEPTTLALLGFGFLGLLRKRRAM